jgi:hypothetical protein
MVKPKPPAFQFYPKDWLSSKTVLRMTPAQCGYFINLLANAWDNDPPGTLPNDPDILWRLARAESKAVFEADGALVLTQFPLARGGKTRFNHKLTGEYKAQVARRLRFSRAGRAGANAKWDNKLHGDANGDAIKMPMASMPCSASAFASASASAKHNKARRSQKTLPFCLPDWVPKEAWNSYLEMRNRIKKPATNHAMELAVRKLEELANEGYSPAIVLEQSILNSWQGLFTPNGNRKEHVNGTGKTIDRNDTRTRDRRNLEAAGLANPKVAVRTG